MSTVIRAFNFLVMLASVGAFWFSPSLFCSWVYGPLAAAGTQQGVTQVAPIYNAPQPNMVELQYLSNAAEFFSEYESFDVKLITAPNGKKYAIDRATDEKIFEIAKDAENAVGKFLAQARTRNRKLLVSSYFRGKLINCEIDTRNALKVGEPNQNQQWIPLDEFDFIKGAVTYSLGDEMVRLKIKNKAAMNFVGTQIASAKRQNLAIEINFTALDRDHPDYKYYQQYLPGSELIRVVPKN
jgi:hypothetical protein